MYVCKEGGRLGTRGYKCIHGDCPTPLGAPRSLIMYEHFLSFHSIAACLLSMLLICCDKRYTHIKHSIVMATACICLSYLEL